MDANTTTPQDQAVIAAIRADALVGSGSCSYIDECLSDAELVERFARNASGRRRLPAQALRAAQDAHKIWADVMEDRFADAKNSAW